MGLFGFGNNKNKNAALKKDILKELGSVNSSSIEMNKKINQLEELVSDHAILGDKDETKVLEELLGQIAHIKATINAGRESAARTSITQSINIITDKWATSAFLKNFKEEENAQNDLDKARDELTKASARQQELRAILTAHPEQAQYYAAEWNLLQNRIKILNQDIATYTKEQQNVQIAEQLQEQHKKQQKIENRRTIQNEEIQKSMVNLQADREKQAEWNQQIDAAQELLFGDTAQNGVQLEGFNQSSSTGIVLEGLDLPGLNQSAGVGGTQKVQESATIQQALKKVEENLARLEDANEDLKDKLAEKDREYNRTIAKTRELLLQRDKMSPAEYNTIDYKINEMKLNIVSLNKMKMSYQNVLQQNNLKIALLKQLQTEKDLDIVNKYGVNIDMMTANEMAAYLSAKGDEKNSQIAELDALTGGVLNTSVDSLTDTAEGDLSDVSGDPNAWDELKKVVGLN